MFARRKHSPLEDEPLVPHGLIWQATDEPDRGAELHLANPKPAEVAEIPLRQEHALQNKNQGTAPASLPASISIPPAPVPANLGAISPPIPWPSPKSASVIRRAPPVVAPAEPKLPVTQLQNTAPKISAPPTLAPQARATEDNTKEAKKAEIVRAARALRDPFSKRVKAAAQVVKGQAHKSYGSATHSLVQARRRAAAAYESIDLRGPISHVRDATRNYARAGVAKSRSAQEGLRSWWVDRQPDIAQAKSAVGGFSSAVAKAARARSEDLSQRLRSYQLRIRIVQSPFAQGAIQRSRLALAARRKAFRREPRLWTSLGMAALSALLTLSVISAVSHYRPSADASTTKSSTQSPTPVAPASLIAPKTALASARSEKSPTHQVEASLTQSKPSAARGTEKPVTRRVRRNDDDDYVAPDTYRYYGTAGKSR